MKKKTKTKKASKAKAKPAKKAVKKTIKKAVKKAAATKTVKKPVKKMAAAKPPVKAPKKSAERRPALAARTPINLTEEEHEGATEDQVGDRTGPGAGYDTITKTTKVSEPSERRVPVHAEHGHRNDHAESQRRREF